MVESTLATEFLVQLLPSEGVVQEAVDISDLRLNLTLCSQLAILNSESLNVTAVLGLIDC